MNWFQIPTNNADNAVKPTLTREPLLTRLTYLLLVSCMKKSQYKSKLRFEFSKDACAIREDGLSGGKLCIASA